MPTDLLLTMRSEINNVVRVCTQHYVVVYICSSAIITCVVSGMQQLSLHTMNISSCININTVMENLNSVVAAIANIDCSIL